MHRPYRVPGGMAGRLGVHDPVPPPGPCSRLSSRIFPGFLDGQFLNNADLPTNVSRVKYETISLVAIGVTMIAGLVFYWLGTPTRAASVVVPLEGNEGLGGMVPAVARAVPESATPPSLALVRDGGLALLTSVT